MPLTDLVRYFNSDERQGDSTLYLVEGRVAAWHDGLRLGSLFQPVHDLNSGRIAGHRAVLAVQADDGSVLDAAAAYARCRDDTAVVRFDRLCRTVHALNFLGQQRHAGGHVQLDVHPRHLLAVQGQHGLVFEAILKRCGLGPEDIVLAVEVPPAVDRARLARALDNYRQRGYRLALSGLPADIQAAALAEWRPDLLQAPAVADSRLGEVARQAGVRLQWLDVADATDEARARAAGVDLATGDFYGGLQVDCLPTHADRRVA